MNNAAPIFPQRRHHGSVSRKDYAYQQGHERLQPLLYPVTAPFGGFGWVLTSVGVSIPAVTSDESGALRQKAR